MPDNDYSDTKQNDVNKSTISNIQIDAPPNQQEANPKFYKHKKSIYREMSSFEKIMVWLTALGFVVATASIIALVCSINNADRNFRMDQRAWIGLKGFSSNIDTDSQFIIEVTFKNTGKTFAKRLFLYGATECIPSQCEPSFTQDEVARRGVVSFCTVPPQGTSMVSTWVDNGFAGFSNKDWRDIKSGKSRIYFHGMVEYDDIFGRHHWTRVCYYYSPKKSIWYPYKKYNDTDD